MGLLHQRQPGTLLQLLGHDPQPRPAGCQTLQRLGLRGDCQRPWTLVHGDLRADNLLFGRTPEDPDAVIIDWFWPCRIPPVSASRAELPSMASTWPR